MMSWRMLAAAAAFGLTTSAASATTINASYQVAGEAFGTEGWGADVKIESVGATGIYGAGAFRMTGDGGLGDFIAFCIDIYEPLTDNQAYDASGTIYGPAIVQNIDKLFTSAFTQVTDAVSAAAFQISLWEIVYDTDKGLNLDSGDFFTALENGAEYNVAVENQADLFLAGLASAGTGGYDLTFLANDGAQDLVTGSAIPTPPIAPVPVPAAGLMLLSGLGGIAALRRRKKTA